MLKMEILYKNKGIFSLLLGITIAYLYFRYITTNNKLPSLDEKDFSGLSDEDRKDVMLQYQNNAEKNNENKTMAFYIFIGSLVLVYSILYFTDNSSEAQIINEIETGEPDF
jgi:hypothetical protein